MLQFVAVCCSVLQYVAVCCSVLQCVAVCCSALQCAAVCGQYAVVSTTTCVDVMSHTCAKVYDACVDVTHTCQSVYRVAKTHRIPYLYRLFSAKEPYI